jgi:phage tail-like protein
VIDVNLSIGSSGSAYPFAAFRFAVEIDVPGLDSPDLLSLGMTSLGLPSLGNGNKLCGAAFSECDGLEMTMDVKTIREGGNNSAQIRLAGPRSYGQITLKRGMTASFDLWNWMSATLAKPALRGSATVVLLAADGKTERARFLLDRCLPIKLKAPPLNARDGLVAIEEFQMAYESLSIQAPGNGLNLGAAVNVGVSL